MMQAAKKPHLHVVDEAPRAPEPRPISPAPRPAPEIPPWTRRLTTRGAIAAVAAAAAAAAVFGGALALAVDPFADDAPRTVAPPPATTVWERLDTERADLRGELAAAETPQEQARIANKLATAYDDAALAAGAGAQPRAARAARDAYVRLATAAEAGDRPGYVKASEAIALAEQRLQARR